MNAYEKQTADRKAAFSKLVNAIAKAIGNHALVSRCDDGIATILLGDGLGLYLHKQYSQPRLDIGGVWPRNAKGETHSPTSYDKSDYKSITVSTERTPEQIAKDIQRRFLPGYAAEFFKQSERARSADTYATDTQDTLRLAAAAAGLPLLDNRYRENNANLHIGDTSTDLEASGQTVTVKLRSLSREHAQAVLKLVATLNK